jgi:hypothetical protein
MSPMTLPVFAVECSDSHDLAALRLGNTQLEAQQYAKDNPKLSPQICSAQHLAPQQLATSENTNGLRILLVGGHKC